MSEPLMPLPSPERESYHDPTPARCSVKDCRRILSNPHPASRHDSSWEGWCPEHGTVLARYGGTQNPEYPSPEQYADALVELVAEDRYEFPDAYAKVKSWTDLHDVCDANEYLIAADDHFGLDPDYAAHRWIVFYNEAIAIAERKLWKEDS